MTEPDSDKPETDFERAKRLAGELREEVKDHVAESDEAHKRSRGSS